MNYQSSDYCHWNHGPRLVTAAIAALVLALAGCAPLPVKDAPPTFAAARAADLVPDAAASAPAAGAAPVLGDYGDAQLTHLIALALTDSPTMAIVQARVRQADSAAGETRAAAGTTLALDAQATREHYPQHSLYPPPVAGSTRTSGHVALDFAFDFDFWGRNRNALAAALGQAAASRADARAAAATLAAGVAKAYFQWQAADQHLRIAHQVETQRQALVAREARLVRAGLAPGAQLAPLNADVDAPRQNVVQLETQRAQAERQLQALVGLHALPALQPAPLPAPSVVQTAGLRLDLLAQRPEVAAARDRVQAALNEVDSQRAAFYPDISISALAGFDSIQLTTLLHRSNRETGVTPAIHLPIFDAGRLRAGLDARRADVALAVAQYDQAVQQAVGDVNDATVRLQGAQREAAPLEGQRRGREHDLASATRREQAGLIDGRERLVDELVLTALQDQEVNLRLQTLLARIDLDHALGAALPAPAQVADTAQ